MGKRVVHAKKPAPGSKRHRQQQMLMELASQESEQAKFFRPKRLEAKTEAQGHYLLSIESKQLTLGIGPAGTGKTYVCTTHAAQQLADKKVSKLIVTRPAIEAGKGMGFLPGTVEEKFEPYFAPFRQILEDFFGRSHLEYLMKRGYVQIAPLEYIRGLTFDDAFVILDEAQNTTPTQMKLFLTRLGEYSKVVVNGDIDQQDVSGLSGLDDARRRLQGLQQVGICHFTEEDVVRSGLVRDILLRYRSN